MQISQADRDRVLEPRVEASTNYPSVTSSQLDIMLVPTLNHLPGQCIALPVPTSERAADLVMRLNSVSAKQPSAIAWTGTVSTVASHAQNAFGAVSEYFQEIHRAKSLAVDTVAALVTRYRQANGRLTEVDFLELVAKRSAVQQVIELAAPPIFRFHLIERSQFEEWSRMEATLRSLPPGRGRAILAEQWRQLQNRFINGFASKSIAASKQWALRLARAAKVMLVIEFAANVAALFMATNLENLNKASAKLAAQAAGIVGAALATFLATKAAAAGVAGLAVVFAITPVGWVVVAAGFAAGLAAGFYIPDYTERFTYEYLRKDLGSGLP
ncbi:hypothetical protein [Rhizobium leguminosarum]|uniref:hypothetical protein n=1 Tax=Rhizobium leguminosarum TaxID=384 RepID=UPI003F982AA7